MTDLKHNATQAILAVYAHADQLEARVAELEALQGNPELWCVRLQGSGEILAMKSKGAAEHHAGEFNSLGLDGVTASVIRSPWPQDIHFAKAFRLLESWLDAANQALQAKSAELVKLRGLIGAGAIASSRVGNPD